MTETDLDYVTRRIRQDANGCWLWRLALDRDGYGLCATRRGTSRAHRLSYTAHRGPIPDGMVIDHLCRVRACVNPDHLEPVTPQANTDRGDLHLHRGRAQRERTHCKDGHPLTTRGNSGVRFCAICNHAANEATRARAKRRDPAQLPADLHGRTSTYAYYGCRCQPCKDAQNAYQREHRAAKRRAG